MKNKEKVIDFVKEFRKQQPRVGTRKLLPELKEKCLNIGRDAFFKVLKEQDLLIEPKKKFSRTTYSNHGYVVAPNEIKNLAIVEPNQVWVSDITYIRLSEGKFAYLFLTTDLYSRKIMGYHLSQDLTHHGALICLNNAITLVGDPREIIHHSDRGVQYCCHEFKNLIQNFKMKLSMTDENHCYQNAVAERLNGILKDEFDLDKCFENIYDAKRSVERAVSVYNNRRRHFSLNLMTPEQFYEAA